MNPVSLDRNGSPKRKTLSRGMSEDESLRSVIKETESSSRRLTRSDSRGISLKKRSDTQQSDQDLFMGPPEMFELQASYDEVVQELHRLEVEREGLLFQVDILQDTLEGVEELLAEAQREAGQANVELEREREARKTSEDMVCSLTQEVERLKEERDTTSPVPAHRTGGETTGEEELISQMHQVGKEDSPGAFREDNVGKCSWVECEEVGKGEGTEHNGSPLTKLHKKAHIEQLPTLVLGAELIQEGIYRRPYESPTEDGQDPSPEKGNDTDSISAYEDASAETPEEGNLLPDVTACDAVELPDDAPVNEEGGAHNCLQDNSSEPSNSKPVDTCVLS